MQFRRLNANEIDCRISTISAKGLSLLLYKDARVDMRILDETVGAENWQRSHELINGNLFCNVSIYIPERGEWVTKQDVGTESYTEKEKGQASDSFKRACFNWGIGRELYSAPFIWISSDRCNIAERNGKAFCNDRFTVTDIGYDYWGEINRLTIWNEKTKAEVFKMGKATSAKPQKKAAEEPKVDRAPIRGEVLEIKNLMKQKGYDVTPKAEEQLESMAKEALTAYLNKLKALPNKGEKNESGN